jgi:hypothetical protein
VLLDTRLWLLIGLSIAMLFTIEAIEDYVEGTWPQMRRPNSGAGAIGHSRSLWVGVALLVLPGLVLTILNLAILLWQNLTFSNMELLGTIFVVVGWLLFLATTINLGGIGTYFEDVGFVAPLSLVMILLIGDLLLFLSLIDIFPRHLHGLLP